MFLEGDGALALCPDWQRLQPANGTLLDGMARLPKQLLGMLFAVDLPIATVAIRLPGSMECV